jgi:hypothetical protein
MVIHARELCPNCVEMTEVTEHTETVREDTNCLVKRIIRTCRSCNQELANTVMLQFKVR